MVDKLSHHPLPPCPWWEGVVGGNKKEKANIGQLVRWGTNRKNIFVP